MLISAFLSLMDHTKWSIRSLNFAITEWRTSISFNQFRYFDNVIKTNERKNEKRRRVKRSQSGDLSSISPSKPILKDTIAGKENRSKISNFYESNRDIDNKGESRLKRQKSVTKKVPKTNTSKCSGGFLLKKISEKVKNPKQIQ